MSIAPEPQRRIGKSSLTFLRVNAPFLSRVVCAGLFGAGLVTAFGQTNWPPEFAPRPSPELQRLLDGAVRKTLARFAARKLAADQLAATLLDLGDAAAIHAASYRGETPIYPASVVKLFFLAAAHRWMADGKLRDSPELERALRDMTVDSSNDASHYVLDVLTGATSGPELAPPAMREWAWKRNALNRYFFSRGYRGVNLNQKPWCEGPYGRERAFVGVHYENRNRLTTDATARLLAQLALGTEVSSQRSAQMMALLRRDPFGPASDPDDQSHGFTGPAVPRGGRLWSKAGWTSEARHDAAYLELPGGARLVLVIFTVGHAQEREIIPALAGEIIQSMGR